MLTMVFGVTNFAGGSKFVRVIGGARAGSRGYPTKRAAVTTYTSLDSSQERWEDGSQLPESEVDSGERGRSGRSIFFFLFMSTFFFPSSLQGVIKGVTPVHGFHLLLLCTSHTRPDYGTMARAWSTATVVSPLLYCCTIN